MVEKLWVIWFYLIIGFIFLIFNKYIANLVYGFILFYTNKLNIKDVFFFKVDSGNRNSLIALARSFVIIVGISIVSFAFFLYNS